ncbi:MAG: hypothetical protein KC442_22620 [Thermomicrobiales bacterium]|nr:hypothetical protein [Thermomicrobiales bacterium]
MLTPNRSSLRLAVLLLLVGQALYIVITQFHTGGDANDHHAIFAAYAASDLWTAVHAGQFAAMAILLAGLFVLAGSLDVDDALARWASRCGGAAAVAALALYGALQAVDGVANKQADVAWLNAPAAEQAARFASAEAIRWIEWGLRSYHDYALGLALALVGLAATRASWAPRPVGFLIGLSGLVYLAQGWVAGVEGFSPTQSLAIVLAWAVSLLWMLWLAVVARRLPPA